MNLLGHENPRRPRTPEATSRATTGQKGGPGFPQVSLETALLAALQVRGEHPDASPLPADELRRLLGFGQTSGDSVRLLVGLQLYGLIERTGRAERTEKAEPTYVFTPAALHLLETADERAFRRGLQEAAARPELLRELASRYGSDLDSRELRDDLKGRRLPENERRTLMKVLRDNHDLLGQTARQGALFGRVALQHSRVPVGQGSAVNWLRSLPGRTANLTLAAVVFVTCLVGAALLPGQPDIETATRPGTAPTPTAPVARTIAPPLAAVSVPPAQVSPSGSSTAGLVSDTASAPSRQAAQAQTAQPQTTQTEATSPQVIQQQATPRPSVETAPRPTASGTVSSQEARTRPVQRETAPTATTATPAQTAEIPAVQTPAVQTPAAQTPTAPTAEATTSDARNDSAQAPSTQAQSAEASSPLLEGRRLASLLYSQRLTRLWATFSPGVQQEWGSFPAFREYRLGGLSAYGAETRVVSEEVRKSGSVTYYLRTATFERGPDHDWTLILGLDAARQVVEFNIVAAGVLPGLTASAEH